MSALVWSVESAIIGAWALVFSFYSTPFIAFIARCHSLIAGFTLILQLVSTARDLPIGHAISEAFVCAVTALLLVFVAAVLDRDNHARFFSMPSAGLFPMDAAICAAWFCAAFVSAMGMALSGVGRAIPQDSDSYYYGDDGQTKKSRRKASLMFHQYGYHMSIVLPASLILWLYNYDASNTNEPVRKGIRFVSNNAVTVTHMVLFLVYAGIWGCFVLVHAAGEGLLSMGRQWPSSWSEMGTGERVRYISSVMLKWIGHSGCVLIPLSAVFVSKTYAQAILAWVLVGVAGVYAIDLLSLVDRLAGKRNEVSGGSRIEDDGDYAPSAPPLYADAEIQLPAPLQAQRQDPAAVVMGRQQLTVPQAARQQQGWRREKNV